MFRLRCSVKNYEWGKKNLESFVAQIIKATEPAVMIENKPYAELWMGAHPSGPNFIIEGEENTNITLAELIEKNPRCLGEKISKYFGNQLPFLFKVLSVNKALSIQAHPNKSHAEKLHKEKPNLYLDPNHKPEMAIALTNFEALCGFRPLVEIQNCLKETPELCNVVGEAIANQVINSPADTYHSALKECFTALMCSSEEVFRPQLDLLVERFSKMEENDICKLFLRIHSQFPGDIGCFALFFLNYIILKPGEALFLAANEPHAYLFGDCIECMACSDNVVRAGLTPKFKDVQTLCEMLTYKCCSPKETLFYPKDDENDAFRKIFNPPVPDFAVLKIEVPPEINHYVFSPLESASIILIVKGNCLIKTPNKYLKSSKGSVLFISSDQKFEIEIEDGLLMFCAYCDLQ
ncbi:mannose-6-phosphate isomerase [Centruroides vittatus]|uniref:mannose-6-phosphate isomerase n=1 Tax=Centruroides vittatus TaxID=120091 RepID=UPI00350EBEEE